MTGFKRGMKVQSGGWVGRLRGGGGFWGEGEASGEKEGGGGVGGGWVERHRERRMGAVSSGEGGWVVGRRRGRRRVGGCGGVGGWMSMEEGGLWVF